MKNTLLNTNAINRAVLSFLGKKQNSLSVCELSLKPA